jgi:hypothetical protein
VPRTWSADPPSPSACLDQRPDHVERQREDDRRALVPAHLGQCLQVGKWGRDSLVLDDRLAEGLALDGVVARELKRRAGDPDHLGGHHRPRPLERPQCG